MTTQSQHVSVPQIQHSLPTMIVADCKYEDVKLVQKDATWHGNDIDPTTIRHFNCRSVNILQVLFIPKGQWFMTLLSDGTLYLHPWPDLEGHMICSTESSDANQPNFDYEVDVELFIPILNSVKGLVWENYVNSCGLY